MVCWHFGQPALHIQRVCPPFPPAMGPRSKGASRRQQRTVAAGHQAWRWLTRSQMVASSAALRCSRLLTTCLGQALRFRPYCAISCSTTTSPAQGEGAPAAQSWSKLVKDSQEFEDGLQLGGQRGSLYYPSTSPLALSSICPPPYSWSSSARAGPAAEHTPRGSLPLWPSCALPRCGVAAARME